MQLREDLKECSFAPKIDDHSNQIAQKANERAAMMNQFSAMDNMIQNDDLHEIAQLQQSPNFKAAYHNFHPDSQSTNTVLNGPQYYGNMIGSVESNQPYGVNEFYAQPIQQSSIN